MARLTSGLPEILMAGARWCNAGSVVVGLYEGLRETAAQKEGVNGVFFLAGLKSRPSEARNRDGAHIESPGAMPSAAEAARSRPWFRHG
jgi:hypothetical protein